MKIETDVQNLKATNISTSGDEFVIENASLIMGYISDQMYSFPIRTTVQEYLSNARDAMTAVGNTFDKIIITSPTELNPNFSVRDFGISMTHAHMVDVFRKYGASDKRHTDDAIGGWGLGSKIAWSTVDSFTIVCYLDGEKRTYLAHKGVNNNGMLSSPMCEDTEEPNGVEIIIPVGQNNISAYKKAIERSILFCREEVQVRGLLPEEINTVEFTQIEEDFFIAPQCDINRILGLDSWSDNAIAVIAGVPYEISKGNCYLGDIEDMLKNSIPIFIVKTGDLDVPVQRESLKYSEKTVENLEEIGKWALECLKRHIITQFEICGNPKEFFDLYRAARKIYKFGRLIKPEYDVYNIKDARVYSYIIDRVKLQRVHNKSKRYPYHQIQKISRSVTENFHIDQMSDVFYVDDRNETKVKQNRRIRTHLKDNDQVMLLSAIYPKDGDVVVPTHEDELSPTESFLKLIKDFGIKPISSVPMVDVVKREKNALDKGVINIHCWNVRGRKWIKSLDLSEIEDEFLYVVMTDRRFVYTDPDMGNLSTFANLRDDKIVCGVSATNARKIRKNENFQPLEEWIATYVPISKDYDSIRVVAYDRIHIQEAKEKISMIKEVFTILGTDFVNEDFRSRIDWIEDNDLKTVSSDYVPDVIKDRMDVKDIKDKAKKFSECCQEFRTLFDSSFPLLDNVHYWNNDKTKKEIAIYMKAKLDS